MTEPESVALPLGDAAIKLRARLYHKKRNLSRCFFKNIIRNEKKISAVKVCTGNAEIIRSKKVTLSIVGNRKT